MQLSLHLDNGTCNARLYKSYSMHKSSELEKLKKKALGYIQIKTKPKSNLIMPQFSCSYYQTSIKFDYS